MIVFLDPSHNGANDASLTRQVPTGRGGTKDCQTSGTSTESGFPEHTFNWDTVLLIRQELTQLGVRTAMSRGKRRPVAACVDERAAMANSPAAERRGVDPRRRRSATGRGFHVNYPAPAEYRPGRPSVQFARIMRDQLAASGIPAANYIGSDGLYGRADLAGLNLAQYPSILVELGNMKNPADSALMESQEGRQKYADAVVKGHRGLPGDATAANLLS